MTRSIHEVWPRRALDAAGLDPNVPLQRMSSVTNDVWASAQYVVRVNRRWAPRLQREAELGSKLPAEVGYPPVVAAGGQGGFEWLILRRLPGVPLAHAWPDMDHGARREAVRQLAGRLRALHRSETPPGLAPVRAPHMLADLGYGSMQPLIEAICTARDRAMLEPDLADDLLRMVRDGAATLLPYATGRLVHGDLTFENVLWDGRGVVALLDFEYCRGAPPDLDLDVLLRTCAYPRLHVGDAVAHRTRAEDYLPVPGWLAEDYPELLSHPRRHDRCRIFSIAYDVSDLLAQPVPERMYDLPPFHPVNRLRRTAAGTDQLGIFLTGMRA